jgi:hypothetical protein
MHRQCRYDLNLVIVILQISSRAAGHENHVNGGLPPASSKTSRDVCQPLRRNFNEASFGASLNRRKGHQAGGVASRRRHQATSGRLDLRI